MKTAVVLSHSSVRTGEHEQLIEDSHTAETGSEEAVILRTDQGRKAAAITIQSLPIRKGRQNKQEKPQGPEPTNHRAFRSVRLRGGVVPNSEWPEALKFPGAHANCFWLLPNCSSTVNDGKTTRHVFRGKRPVVREQKAAHCAFDTGSKHTTTEITPSHLSQSLATIQ